jgi:hypothetical protein
MKKERRSQQRVTPKDLQANLQSSESSAQKISLNAEIMDISRTGIRIKLNEPLDKNTESKVIISMHLPDSGTPFSVNCILKNQHSQMEYGLRYADESHKTKRSIDDMLFECVELDESTFLIKPS